MGKGAMPGKGGEGKGAMPPPNSGPHPAPGKGTMGKGTMSGGTGKGNEGKGGMGSKGSSGWGKGGMPEMGKGNSMPPPGKGNMGKGEMGKGAMPGKGGMGKGVMPGEGGKGTMPGKGNMWTSPKGSKGGPKGPKGSKGGPKGPQGGWNSSWRDLKGSKGGPNVGPGQSSCFVIPVFMFYKDLQADFEKNSIGGGFNNVPFYNSQTGEHLGYYSDAATELASNECVGTGEFGFSTNNTSTSQISIQFTCHGKYNPITGGTGSYGCAKGFEVFVYDDGHVIASDLHICNGLCPH